MDARSNEKHREVSTFEHSPSQEVSAEANASHSISASLETLSNNLTSDNKDSTSINTGSGGGGDHNYSAGSVINEFGKKSCVQEPCILDISKLDELNSRPKKRLKAASDSGTHTTTVSVSNTSDTYANGGRSAQRPTAIPSTVSHGQVTAPVSAVTSSSILLVTANNGRDSPSATRKFTGRIRAKGSPSTSLSSLTSASSQIISTPVFATESSSSAIDSSSGISCASTMSLSSITGVAAHTSQNNGNTSTILTSTSSTPPYLTENQGTSIASTSVENGATVLSTTLTNSSAQPGSFSTEKTQISSNSSVCASIDIPSHSVPSNNSNETENPQQSSTISGSMAGRESLPLVSISPKVPPLKIVLGGSSVSGSASAVSIVNSASSSFNRKTEESKSSSVLLNITAANLPVSQHQSNELHSDADSRTLTGLPSIFQSSNAAILVTNPISLQHSNNSSSAASSNSPNEQNNSLFLNSQPIFTSSGRVTRSSQRAAAAQTGYGSNANPGSGDDQSPSSHTEQQTGKESRKRKNRNRSNASGIVGDRSSALIGTGRQDRNATRSSSDNEKCSDQMPAGEEDNESSSSSSVSSVNGTSQFLDRRLFQMPAYNCYHMYLNIRKQVDLRRTQQLQPIHPKPPHNFNRFLVTTGGYLLQRAPIKTNASELNLLNSVNSFELPVSLINSPMGETFAEQEAERRRLRLQHHIEKEKMRLSAEQEILRVHSRAALADSNLNLPMLSACTILKDEEIYNTIDQENDDVQLETICEQNDDIDPSDPKDLSSGIDLTVNEHKTAFTVPMLNTWLQDVYNKWQRIKEEILLRQQREAESLQATQKLNWQWRGKELNFYDGKSNDMLVEERFVPQVQVQEDFELLPTL